ncbi:cytochrome P450 [Bipolaris maydis]|uniref:cytochrome P450 n=1 Tax=Cochliobolus heterostrophus TaxID=5016 RepID=UPI0024DBBF5C|nr:cytochrome P450 [Bipolaris maydis]
MWVVYLATATSILFGTWYRCSRNAANGLPEGPQGCCFTLLRTYPEWTLHRWAQEYGSLYSFTIGNQRFLVVSDPDTAKSLFLSKAYICSDRKETGITSTSYGNIYTIRALYKDSADGKRINPQTHVSRCSINCISAITCGSLGIFDAHSQVLDLSREFMNMTSPMYNLETKRRGNELHGALMDTYCRQLERVQRDIENDVHAGDCLVKTMITRKEKDQLDDLDMTMLASAFMLDGINTTGSIIQWFSAPIPSYLHVQRWAHEELDRVVGRDRLPNLGDEASLPYCRAIVKEVERCHNPFWLGIPQAASKVMFVMISLFRPARWSDPLNFHPDCYLDENFSSTFGVGRRICPGILVAQREIWLAVTKLLWAFYLAQVPGQLIDLKEYDGRSGRSPIPFEILLPARFEGVDDVMAEAQA